MTQTPRAPRELIAKVITAAAQATFSSDAARDLAARIVFSSYKEDHSAREAELAATAASDPATAAAVIRILASATATVSAIAAGR